MHVLAKVVAFNKLRRPLGGVMIYLDKLCDGHTVNRAVVMTFQHCALIPKAYNTSFVFRFYPRYNRLIHEFIQLVFHDLESGGYLLGESSQEDNDHTTRVISLTLCRPMRTRGRSVLDSEAKSPSLIIEI